RCAKTRAQDGQALPIRITGLAGTDSDDGICIDGKRLYPGIDGLYRPESIDFSTVARSDFGAGGNQFTVTTKNGETRYYGSKAYSNVSNVLWALDRVVDAWGNYYDIHYNDDQTDFGDRGLLVTQIDYTGRLADSGPSLPTFASIKVTYED